MTNPEKTLDPKIQPLLAMMAAADTGPLADVDINDFRDMRARGRALINPTWPELKLVHDIDVQGGDSALRARIYDNATDAIESAARPTLIYFHGGGFVYGDLDSHDALCRRLANHGGFRVIAIDYRLAPEHPYPAAIEDAIAVTKHIVRDSTVYGVDAGNLAVGGDSAGGCLSAIVAREAARREFATLRLQLLIYPVTVSGQQTASREAYAEGYFLTEESMAWFDSHYVPESVDRTSEWISPLLHAPPSGLAPAYVITAGFDPLLDEGKAYADLLANAGIATEYLDYPSQVHGFVSFTAFSSDAEIAIERCADAVKRAFA